MPQSTLESSKRKRNNNTKQQKQCKKTKEIQVQQPSDCFIITAPNDVLLRMVKYLSVEDLHCLRLTCKTMASVITENYARGHNSYWSESGFYQREHKALRKALVPSCGSSKHCAGDILSLAESIYHDKYNDGVTAKLHIKSKFDCGLNSSSPSCTHKDGHYRICVDGQNMFWHSVAESNILDDDELNFPECTIGGTRYRDDECYDIFMDKIVLACSNHLQCKNPHRGYVTTAFIVPTERKNEILGKLKYVNCHESDQNDDSEDDYYSEDDSWGWGLGAR